MLKLERISKYYFTGNQVVQALRRINLECGLGEFIAITGESGSGKSTLLNVMSGLDTYEEGVLYSDNDERAIFFAKGVVETVKKLNWVPDIIHVHGWMASLLPIYMKHYYKDEALFSETKIVTSVYSQSFEGSLDAEMINKIKFDGVPQDAIQELELPNYENLIKAAIKHSDGVIIASENVSGSLTKFIESSEKPFLPFASKDKFTEAYTNFYKSMLS